MVKLNVLVGRIPRVHRVECVSIVPVPDVPPLDLNTLSRVLLLDRSM